MFPADWTTLVGDEFLLLIWSAWSAFRLSLHDHAIAVSVLGTCVGATQSFVPLGSDRLLFFVVHAVSFIADAATADGIAEIFVEQFLALFLAFFLGDATDF
jgi:hypothetical protein